MVADIQWEDVPCNLCGSKRSRLMFTMRDYRFLTDRIRFNVVRCVQCALVRVNPRPIEPDIHRYYHDDFYRGQESREEALRNMERQCRAMAGHVNRYPTGRLLDIGCFRGEVMEYMRAEHGWEVAGVEFSERPPNYFGLDIFYGDIANAPYAEESFDVVTLWAVLEHVYDPARMLAQVRRFLKPGGVVIILVPNFNSIQARFMRQDDVPRHLTMFTRATLGRMLKGNSLEPIDWSCGQDLYGGSVRGWLNFIVKRLGGEPMSEILAQNRPADAGTWPEFAGHINGRASSFMRRVDGFDARLAPRLDRVLDRLGLGFIMTVHARKRS